MNTHVSVTSPGNLPEQPALPPDASTARRQREKRRRRRRRVVLLVVAVALAGGGYAAWRTWFQPEATAAVQYLTGTITIGAIEDAVSAVGTLSASESRTVESPLAGRVETLAAAVGAVVAEGDVIATLETADLESAVRLAEAQLTNLEASLADREAQLELQQQNLTRQEGLLAANAVAEATVQQARASVISATASRESVRTQLIQQQQALDTARANLAEATIRAPISGTVVALSSEVGQTVASGTALMTIADLATMTVTAQVSEADIGRLTPGMSAYFTTLAGSARRWAGTLREILPTPTIENNVVLYSLLFDVDNSDGTLMIGMSTEAFFVVAGAQNVLRVPVAALQAVRSAPTASGAPAAGADPDAAAAPVTAQLPAGFDPAMLPAGVDPAEIAERLAGVDPALLAERLGARPGGGGQFAGAAGGQFGAARGAATTAGGTALPTTYTVRVLKDDGTIEERTVEVGVRDRVNAEIRSGLVAGERVVTGTTTAGAATGTAAAGGGAAQNALTAIRGAAAAAPAGGPVMIGVPGF